MNSPHLYGAIQLLLKVTMNTQFVWRDKFARYIFITLCITSLSGCGQGTILKVTQARFDLPETNGVKQPMFNLQVRPENHIVLFGPYSGSQIVEDPDNPRIDTDYNFRGGMSIGLSDRFDIALDGVDLDLDGAMIKSKYMVFGQPYNRSQKNDTSLAVVYAFGRRNNEGDTGFFHDTEIEYSINSTIHDISLVTGYRYSASALIYGGVFRTFYKYDGRTFSGNSPILSPQTTDANFSGRVYTRGFNIGIDYNWATVEVVSSEVRVPNDSEKSVFVNFQLKLYNFNSRKKYRGSDY